ncbi:MAG: hypothetical protein HZC26_02535 [Candidatus Magasanikbacteria bacterium]|nr:hypothetical protein [Candidatus Magasanikbacteria bacterium]
MDKIKMFLQTLRVHGFFLFLNRGIGWIAVVKPWLGLQFGNEKIFV